MIAHSRTRRRWSIPACTGEPYRAGGVWPRPVVYPRVYGGTHVLMVGGQTAVGLSPRVRGNPWPKRSRKTRPRSIPACTGEPTLASAQIQRRRVYPRVYGGTHMLSIVKMNESGLSPRVRGNLRSPVLPGMPLGSIPACTGEPLGIVAGRNAYWVYPRVYGGTLDNRLDTCPNLGLSPRVRGNPGTCRTRLLQIGSIPACTGEPTSSTASRLPLRVYPRVYGGTA